MDQPGLHQRFILPDRLITTLILLTGVVTRFMQVGLIRYTYDQSYPAFQAVGGLDGGIWPLIGQPSSVFLDNPALMPYLQALPLSLFRNPWAVQGFILFLNSAAGWFVWRVATDLIGRRGGWIAAFLFAISPWVIFFSRTTWVQSLVPFFMAVIAWGLWPIFAGERTEARRFLAGGVAVTLLTQTYIQAWGVLPQIGLLLFIFRHRVPKRPFLAALAVFAAAVGLYIFGLSTRVDINATKAGGFLSEGWQDFTAIGLRHASRFVNGIDFRATYAADSAVAPVWATLSTMAVVLLTGCLLAGMIRAVLALRHEGQKRRLAIVLLIWFFVPVLMTSVQGVFDIHPHYLLLTLPAGHFLAAWGIIPLLRPRVGALVVGSLFIAGAIFTHDLYRANARVAQHPTMPAFDGWSLAAGAKVGQAMREHLLSAPGPYPRRIVADGDKALMSGLSASYVQPIRGVEYPDFVVLSAGQPLVYVVDGRIDIPSWLQPYLHLESLRRLDFVDGTRLIVARTLPLVAGQMGGRPDTPVEWPSDAGITLLGYTLGGLAVPGSEIDLVTYWRVDEMKPEQAEWYVATSYHLVDENAGLLSNIGRHGQWAHRWELGDVYIEHTMIPIPESAMPGIYSLEIGLFDSVRVQPYTLFDRGAPVAAYPIAITVESR